MNEAVRALLPAPAHGALGRDALAAHQEKRVADRRQLEEKRLDENRQRAIQELKTAPAGK